MVNHILRGTAEGALWLCAIATLGAAVPGLVAVHAAQEDARPGNPAGTFSAMSPNGATGRLEIASIALTVPLFENYDPVTLRRGVGHVQGTAVAGGLGNMVLAGHRDTFFRPLRNVRAGMQVTVTTPARRFLYQVDSTEVVTPDAVRVLAIGERPELTLITCYPFEYIGAAPQRFIVHAHLVSEPA